MNKTQQSHLRPFRGLAAGLMLCALAYLCEPGAVQAKDSVQKTIVLKTMGSFFFGGTVQTLENGVTFHGEHGYAQYYIPENARNYPIIMWHGIGQSGKTFESTPDGREGYQAILTRRDWPVYIIDQPHRGRAGRTLARPARLPRRRRSMKVLPGMPFVWGCGFLPRAPRSFPMCSSPWTEQALISSSVSRPRIRVRNRTR